MSKLICIALCVVLIALGVTVTDTVAQEAGEGAAVAEQAAPVEAVVPKPTFVKVVFDSGFVGLVIWALIFLASFATIALAVDGFMQTKREKILPDHVVDGVRESLNQGDLGSSVAICEQNLGPLSNILKAGFYNISDGFDVVQDTVSAATDLESEKILQRINYLNLCGQIAPMLGLLGTVTGMVRAFSSLAEAGPTRDAQLALAISGALWTTVAGLLIAVPALLAFTIFKNLATKVLLESEATVLDLIKILRDAEIEDDEDEYGAEGMVEYDAGA